MVGKLKEILKSRSLDPSFPNPVPNWINGREQAADSGECFDKLNPANGETLCATTRSGQADIMNAVEAAKKSQPEWAVLPPVKRGEILQTVALALRERREEVARIIALETGKSHQSAFQETEGASSLGMFMAGEGQRLYGKTTTSAVANRYAMTVREPLGVAGLIVAANTPIANIAWKVFPALICGNSAVLKAAEDAPATAWMFAKIAAGAGLPPGVLNVIQGYGQEAGSPLVEHPDVAVISFTGSANVGRQIASKAGERLAKVSLELGGKNPFVVCDDADIDQALEWAVLSAFSNAGQRCSSGSRMIIFDSIYDEFRDRMVERTKKLKVGPTDQDDFGPVINETRLLEMIRRVERARQVGARILTGGCRLTDDDHRNGFYMTPTLIEGADPDSEISILELFGPIACLYRARDFNEALALANHSPYGLTAAIHTRNFDRVVEFARRIQAGVAVVNGGTYGSEPHMPFGGIKQSGNGSREPGTEALDVYSNLKDVYLNIDPKKV